MRAGEATAAVRGMMSERSVNVSRIGSPWAKSLFDESSGLHLWLPLETHLQDAGGVGRLLVHEWLGPAVRDMVAGPFAATPLPGTAPAEEAERFVAWLGCLHDVGKLTPAFAIKNRALAGVMDDAGLRVDRRLMPEDSRNLRHGVAGQLITERWLIERHGWSKEQARVVGGIVGGHHGIPPSLTEVQMAAARPDLMGRGTWEDTRRELLAQVSRLHDVDRYLERWGTLTIPQHVQVLMSALVIVADWIASNTDFFPLFPVGTTPTVATDRTVRGWSQVALPPPWVPTAAHLPVADLLQSRFELPEGSAPRPCQRATVETAQAMGLPGLLVLEDAMGSGKTEAALLAAEVLAERSGASGVFFALPTMATADATFGRVMRWLDRIAAGPGGATVSLAHGRAALNVGYRDLRRAGRTIDAVTQGDLNIGERLLIHDELPSVYAHVWLSGRKKGPLSDFVVGTIDQVLLAALRSPHLALRHLGLARKVVILDEVHASSAYMNVFLRRALQWLGAYGVPTILLSATLPSALRHSLVEAYLKGVRAAAPADRLARLSAAQRRRRTAPPEEAGVGDSSDPAYPVLTMATTHGLESRYLANALPSSRVGWELWPDDGDLVGELRGCLRGGGCVLIVCNTVRRAQAAYRGLRAEFGGDVHLMHSRFIIHDRLRNDAWLRSNFGPPNDAERPRRSIVVATQVAEQSLDIDFDLLITDLAPMDLLLQRVGRLHRHARPPRPATVGTPRCVVRHVPDVTDPVPQTEKGASAIYGDYLLLRAAAVLAEVAQTGGWTELPTQIASLVAAGYDDDTVTPPTWAAALGQARQEDQRRRQMTESGAKTWLLSAPNASRDLVGWLDSAPRASDDAQGRARVREGEDGIDVLLVEGSTELRVLSWIDQVGGEVVPTDVLPDLRLARAVAMSAVALPASFTRGARADAVLTELEQLMIPAWQRSPLLAGQLILPLIKDGVATLAGRRLVYDQTTGLEEVSLD